MFVSLSAHTSQLHCRALALVRTRAGVSAVHSRGERNQRAGTGCTGQRRVAAVGCRYDANIDCGVVGIERSVTGAERAAWCSGRVVARAAAVGNAVAARQVIVIGAAVPLSRRPSLSARTRTLVAVCVMLAHRSFFSRSRRRLTPRRRRRSRFLRCGGWRPPQGRPDAVGADEGGGRCTPFFFKASLSFLVFFMLVLVSVRLCAWPPPLGGPPASDQLGRAARDARLKSLFAVLSPPPYAPLSLRSLLRRC
ncbi:unnamed protein product [Arctia plantaginis]|uniref:Uncharacterized protein n=1 Tax=Arctia plantaginis TaxID=874455 RepID=A0A8S0Z348_ARCPL|nr:unnamed protein product [Arctia plantaginis]